MFQPLGFWEQSGGKGLPGAGVWLQQREHRAQGEGRGGLSSAPPAMTCVDEAGGGEGGQTRARPRRAWAWPCS